MAAKTVPRGPKSPQERPKTTPRGPKSDPRAPSRDSPPRSQPAESEQTRVRCHDWKLFKPSLLREVERQFTYEVDEKGRGLKAHIISGATRVAIVFIDGTEYFLHCIE